MSEYEYVKAIYKKIEDNDFIILFTKPVWSIPSVNAYIVINRTPMNMNEFFQLIEDYGGKLDGVTIHFDTLEKVHKFIDWFDSITLMKKMTNTKEGSLFNLR